MGFCDHEGSSCFPWKMRGGEVGSLLLPIDERLLFWKRRMSAKCIVGHILKLSHLMMLDCITPKSDDLHGTDQKVENQVIRWSDLMVGVILSILQTRYPQMKNVRLCISSRWTSKYLILFLKIYAILLNFSQFQGGNIMFDRFGLWVILRICSKVLWGSHILVLVNVVKA